MFRGHTRKPGTADSRQPGQGLGGCFAEEEQDSSAEQCYADDKFNHAHNLTPLSGGFDLYSNRPLPQGIKHADYKS